MRAIAEGYKPAVVAERDARVRAALPARQRDDVALVPLLEDTEASLAILRGSASPGDIDDSALSTRGTKANFWDDPVAGTALLGVLTPDRSAGHSNRGWVQQQPATAAQSSSSE